MHTDSKLEFEFAEASIQDIAQMQIVRNSVTENKLSDPAIISDLSYETYLNGKGNGWVCKCGNRIIGFSIADLLEHNVWALFVLPEFENRGVGKQLLHRLLNWYFSKTEKAIWLSTARNTRAETFYTKQLWKPVGQLENGEIKFEMSHETWKNIRSA